MQETQRKVTNTSTYADVRDGMRAAIQNCVDIWNVNRCKAVIVSFYEAICSFHDDFPPHTSSHALLWHRIDVTSWNSKRNGNHTKWIFLHGENYAVPLEVKDMVEGVSPQKIIHELRWIEVSWAQKLQVVWGGDTVWQIYPGLFCWQEGRFWGRKAFYDQAV